MGETRETEEQVSGPVVYEIPEYRLDAFRQVAERVAKKAVKLGLEPFTVTEVAVEARVHVSWLAGEEHSDRVARFTRIVTVEEAKTIPAVGLSPFEGEKTFRPINVHIVQVDGQEPYLEGWRFLAAIDHEGGANIVEQIPGAENPLTVSEWANAAPDCDHCGLKRLRLKTYVLGNDETGEVKQVGSTCIGDFFPGSAAGNIARLADLWSVIDATAREESEWGPGEASTFGGWLREAVMAQACAVVREVGFLGKGKAEEQGRPGLATAAHVSKELTLRPGEKVEFPVTDEDREKGQTVLDWVDDLTPPPSDDYIWNLQSAAARPVCKPRHLGLLVSAVAAYNREQEGDGADGETLIPVPVSDKRVKVTGTILSMRTTQSDWGTTLKMLLLVRTDEGAYKLWGTVPRELEPSGPPPAGNGAEIGDTVSFMARVNRSDRDESFGFWSRPTKAEILERVNPEPDPAPEIEEVEF